MFLAVALLWGYQVSALAVYGENYTTVGLQTQQQTEWCWAASSVAIINTWPSYSTTQTVHVQLVTHNVHNIGRTDPDVLSDFQGYYSKRNTKHKLGPLTYAEIVSRINAGKPIYSGVAWRGYIDVGHAFVVAGYRDGGALQLKIMDPFKNPANQYLATWRYLNYNTYVNAYPALGSSSLLGYCDGSIYDFS